MHLQMSLAFPPAISLYIYKVLVAVLSVNLVEQSLQVSYVWILGTTLLTPVYVQVPGIFTCKCTCIDDGLYCFTWLFHQSATVDTHM